MLLKEKAKKSRAPPLTYDVWPHLIAEMNRKESKFPVEKIRLKR